MRSTLVAGTATAAALLLAGSAQAAVTFDVAGGTGHVGGADLRAAFGWSPAQLRAAADGLAFSYASRTPFHELCLFDPGAHAQTHVRTHDMGTFVVGSEREVAARPTGGGRSVAGFDLTGYTGSVVVSDPPPPGMPCSWTEDGVSYEGSTVLEQGGSYAALFARSGGLERRLT